MDFNTIFNLKKDVDANLHSGGTSQLASFYNTVERGRLRFITKVRPEELIRKAYLEDALFPDVTRYAAPSDMKYKDVIWLKKLDDYRSVDTMDQPTELVYDRRFSQKRGGAGNVMSVGYENGVKYVKVFNPRGLRRCQHVPIQTCDSLTADGTWNVSGNVENFKLDELNHVQGTASYQFDINGSANVGSIYNTTLGAFDLFDYLQRGAVFAWLDIPIPKEMVAVKIKMGSNSADLTTDYYFATVNQPHDNNAFATSWNLLKWMLRNLTAVGTPNPRTLTWVEIEFTTTGQPIPACHIDNIVARKGSVYEVKYNSTYVLMDAFTKAWKKRATSNSDVIVAEEDAYLCLMLEVTLDAQKEIYASSIGAKSDVAAVEAELAAAYRKFRMEHKSEAMLDMDSTHVFGNMYDGYSDDPINGYGGNGPELYGEGNSNYQRGGDANE